MATIPNPEKDQHILIDMDVVKKEIEVSEISPKDKIIEIGPGTGVLTKEILKHSKKLVAFEIDERFRDDLYPIKKEYSGFKVIYGNALLMDWRGYNKLISNLPYGLSEPVIWKSIEDGIDFIVLIVGENFKKIIESGNSKIGFVANLFFDFEAILKIPKTAFNPSPRVNSWLIRLVRKKDVSLIDLRLQRFVMKSGKIKNAIVEIFRDLGKTKRDSKELVSKLGFPEHILEKPVSRVTGHFLKKLRGKLEEIVVSL